MDRDGTWGSDVEMMTASHMLNTTLCMYNMDDESWCTYGPHNVDYLSLNTSVTDVCMYIRHPHNHFDVVLSVV